MKRSRKRVAHFTEPEIYPIYLQACKNTGIGYLPQIPFIDEVKLIKIDNLKSILNDERFKSRCHRKNKIIGEYMKIKSNGNKMPLPIIAQVGRPWKFLLDGYYRISADIRLCTDDSIPVRVIKCDSLENAQWLWLSMHFQTNKKDEDLFPELFDPSSQPRSCADFTLMLRSYATNNPEFKEQFKIREMEGSDASIDDMYDSYKIGVRLYGPCYDTSCGLRNTLRRRVRDAINGKNIKRSGKQRNKIVDVESKIPIDLLSALRDKGDVDFRNRSEMQIQQEISNIQNHFRQIEKSIHLGNNLSWEGGNYKILKEITGNIRILENLLRESKAI